ncbi:DUF456 family protein [Streptomyces sp. MMBL 11-3]|uniref:DUF456 family protein n=1 Tax=Streptomyces sp. MMBL 11-3 TaxID=3382639 RepID=UPI0039B4F95F
MGAWELLLVGVVLLLGLAGVLVPGAPGSWLVWAAVLWWAFEEPRALSWGVLGAATATLLVAQAVRWRLRLGGHREAAVPVCPVPRLGGPGVLVELIACLLVAGAWLGAVIWG